MRSKKVSQQLPPEMPKEELALRSPGEEAWPPLSDLRHVPTNFQQRLGMSRQLEMGLVQKFRETLSQDESSMMENAPSNWSDLPNYRVLLAKFDDFILREMRLFGWRLLLIEGVLERIAMWSHVEPGGRLLLESMGKELSLFVGIQRGEERYPLDDSLLYSYRTKVIAELKSLLSISKMHFAQECRPPPDAQIIDHFRVTIERERKVLPLLHGESLSFLNVLTFLFQQGGHCAARLRRGDLPPAELFNQWMALATNRSAEAARQEISKLGKPSGSGKP